MTKDVSARGKWRLSPECTPQCAKKTLDAADGFIEVVQRKAETTKDTKGHEESSAAFHGSHHFTVHARR